MHPLLELLLTVLLALSLIWIGMCVAQVHPKLATKVTFLDEDRGDGDG